MAISNRDRLKIVLDQISEVNIVMTNRLSQAGVL